MRGMMRSTAQAKGRDPKIAESMVDTSNVLSLTPEEAIEVGYCEGIFESELEVAEAVAAGNSFEIKNMKDDMTWLDKLLLILLDPLLQSIFMMMIIGGIFVEIRTPGIGLPLVTAIVGALLYFAPAYVGHLAEHWEILMFVIGLILIGVEIFVIPGFGVCGISGIVLVIISLALSMVDNVEFYRWDGTIDITPVIKPLGIVIISSAAAIFGSVWLVRRLYPTRAFDHVALREEMKASDGYTGVVSGLEDMIGMEVTVFTDMRPSGKVISADGKILEATMRFGGYASKGEVLKVIAAEQGRLYCDK
jgi:membrane-bound serine protease (ClpP class)